MEWRRVAGKIEGVPHLLAARTGGKGERARTGDLAEEQRTLCSPFCESLRTGPVSPRKRSQNVFPPDAATCTAATKSLKLVSIYPRYPFESLHRPHLDVSDAYPKRALQLWVAATSLVDDFSMIPCPTVSMFHPLPTHVSYDPECHVVAEHEEELAHRDNVQYRACMEARTTSRG